MNDCFKAYLAGLFDGEGSIGIYFSGGSPSLRVIISMTDFTGVGLLKEAYPDSQFYTKSERLGTRKVYVWAVKRSQSWEFLNDIEPYAIVKHEQVSLALQWLSMYNRFKAEYRGGRGVKYPQEYYEQSKWFSDKLKAKKVPDAKSSIDALLQHGLHKYKSDESSLEQHIEFLSNLFARSEAVSVTTPSKCGCGPTYQTKKD